VGGDRRTADVVESLEHLHPATGAGQVGGSHQPVVPAADDDDVESRHRSAKVAFDLVCRPNARRSRIAAGLTKRPALTQQIPALVQLDLECA